MCAWIEVHQSLPTHPKTLEVAMLLDVPEAEVVGHMVCLWIWAIDAKPDGHLDLSKPRIIARAAQWEKEPGRFVDALIAVRFLDENGAIHDWDDYTGRLMERRERTNDQTRVRMQAFRERRRLSSIEAPVTEDVTRNKSRRYASVTPSYAPTQPNPTVPNQSLTTPVDRIAPAVPDASRTSRNGTFPKADRDAMWEAVASECGDAIMPESKSLRGKVVGRLLAAHYSPGQIASAAETYRRRYEVDLTDTALAKHIDRLLTTDDPVPRAPPSRHSRSVKVADAIENFGKVLDDAGYDERPQGRLSSVRPELRGLPS